MISRLLLLSGCAIAFTGCSWDEPTLWNTTLDPEVRVPDDSPLWGEARPGDTVRLLKARGVHDGRSLYQLRGDHPKDPIVPAGSILVVKDARFFKLPAGHRDYRVSLELDGLPYTLGLESKYPEQIFSAGVLKHEAIAIARRSR